VLGCRRLPTITRDEEFAGTGVGLAWFRRSSSGMAEQFGRIKWEKARLFISRFRPRRPVEMPIPNAVEILLVEDNPHDAE